MEKVSQRARRGLWKWPKQNPARMESKDGKAGFDFTGTYDEVQLYKVIADTLDDCRKVEVTFANDGKPLKGK